MVTAFGMAFGIVGWIVILSGVWRVVGWLGRTPQRRAEKALVKEIKGRWSL